MTYTASQNGNDNSGGVSFTRMMKSFSKRIPLMLVVFVLLAGTGWILGSQLKRTYSAYARMMVTISDDYVFQPSNGANTGGMMLTPDSITLNEVAIMNNPELIEQVIGEIGYSRLFPEDSAKFARATGLERDNIRNDMLKKMESSYGVGARPKSSVIDLSFEHEDPQVAVETLNSLIEAYKVARRAIFVENVSDLIAERRMATEEQLLTVDKAIASFLSRNGISDFTSEREGVRERTEGLRAELNLLRGSMREAEAALASTEDRLRVTPPTIDLYVDDRASQRVAQAELERKQLLAKYLPSSDPVKAKEREITELRQLISSNGGAATGGRRVGPNTVHQALMTERNKFQALADSYREKEYVLEGQLKAANAKVSKLSSLDPQYQNILREKKTLEVQLEQLNAREQTALVDQQQAEVNSENVKVINRATLPRKGRNMKKIVQFLSIIGAAFTAIMIGLLGAFLDPETYGAPTRARGTRSSDGRGRRDSDRAAAGPSEYMPAQSVPEPVQPYTPPAAPAYAPAAVHASAMGGQAVAYDPAQYGATGTDGGYGYYDDGMSASANPYAQPAAEAAYSGAYEGSTMDNPYLQQQSYSAGEQYVAGPNGEQVPIIGQMTTPYSGQ